MAHKGKINKEKTKQEIHEKVREIRLRQHNWLKQREDHLSSSSTAISCAEHQPSHSVIKEKGKAGKEQVLTLGEVRAKRSTEVTERKKVNNRDDLLRKQPTPVDTQRQKAHISGESKNRFEHWRNARKQASETPQSDLVLESARAENSGRDLSDRATHSVNSYKTESDDVSLSRFGIVMSASENEETTSDQLDCSSQDEALYGQSYNAFHYEEDNLPTRTVKNNQSGAASQRKQLSPEEFDSLADEIIRRVKDDLKTSATESRNSSRKEDFKLEVRNSFKDQEDRNVHTENDKTENPGLDGHKCVICKKPMVQANHIPVLFIPCGHTVCKTCAEPQKFCTFCGTSITSKTANVMLQKVIEDFYQKDKLHGTSGSGGHSNRPVYNSNYYQIEKGKKKHINYDAELNSLLVRQEVLVTTTQDISTTLDQLDKKKEKQQAQIIRITQEEERIMKDIALLEEKLRALSMHKKEYQERLEELDKEQFDEKNKLALTQETLKSLKGQIEKMKLLLHGTD